MAGGLALLMGLAHPLVKRAPFTPAMIYLLVGVALGPWIGGVARIDPLGHASWLHHASEIAVIISLFTVGLKLRVGPLDRRLRPALWLAFVSMPITVALVAAAAAAWLGLPWGAAILFGGIIAPTDPVLASDVQLRDPHDHDVVRLTLSGEAGLNDGTAFPFVMLGLAWLHGDGLGAWGWRWWTADVLWPVCAGIAIGAGLGHAVGRLLLHLTRRLGQAVAFGEYLVLGVICVSYALALELQAYGFLSVFAAGVALRAAERRTSPRETVKVETAVSPGGAGQIGEELASNPRTAPTYLAGVLLSTNEQLDHLLEVTLVLVVGITLASAGIAWEMAWFAPLLFIVIRPAAVLPMLAGRGFTRFEFSSIAWFGIRGVGSVYYLFYAIDAGLPEALARQLASLTMTLVAVSIIVHGVSVTPWFALKDATAERAARGA